MKPLQFEAEAAIEEIRAETALNPKLDPETVT